VIAVTSVHLFPPFARFFFFYFVFSVQALSDSIAISSGWAVTSLSDSDLKQDQDEVVTQVLGGRI
jgi:hypothetical protein